ncbi:helix-turn-helix domain-containing protein [Erwinia sp. INIA01]|uniref:helix-turn-helix domain-containing protein n=1 Tax=Erwinia sp. INIA01 TaxID=2991500 RepID=UPI00325FD670
MSPRCGAFATFSGRFLLMLVTMSNKELHRLPVIQAVIEKRLRRRDAATQLQLTERQVQRLMNRYRESGAAGLTNARRGKPGTNFISC